MVGQYILADSIRKAKLFLRYILLGWENGRAIDFVRLIRYQ
jgi:hypothetical protein